METENVKSSQKLIAYFVWENMIVIKLSKNR